MRERGDGEREGGKREGDVREGGEKEGDVREGDGGRNGDLAAIAEVVCCNRHLPLWGVEYGSLRVWVGAVLRGHNEAPGTGPSRHGMAHSDGADAVSLLIQRVIADAEREVALETVATGEAEEIMETDDVFQMTERPRMEAETAHIGMRPSQTVIGTSQIVTQLPHSIAGTSQSSGTSEGVHERRNLQSSAARSTCGATTSISSSSEETTCSVPSQATPTSADLLERCVYGVAVCSVRCPAYYKPLYRLASTLHSLGHSQASQCHHFRGHQVIVISLFCWQVAQRVLLGPLPGALLGAQEKLQPLFVLKPNIFAVSDHTP